MKAEPKEAHVYFPASVFATLKKLAKTNRRTMSAEIVIAVEAHLKPKGAKHAGQ